jgi:hypothetical protein
MQSWPYLLSSELGFHMATMQSWPYRLSSVLGFHMATMQSWPYRLSSVLGFHMATMQSWPYRLSSVLGFHTTTLQSWPYLLSSEPLIQWASYHAKLSLTAQRELIIEYSHTHQSCIANLTFAALSSSYRHATSTMKI